MMAAFVVAGTLIFGFGGSGGMSGGAVKVTAVAMLWPYHPAVGVACAILAISALTILLWARVTLGRNWSGRIVLKEGHELVTSGPYAYVRHPIYSGFILLIFATALQFASLASFVGFLIFLAIFLWRTYREDALMSKTFPAEYPAYKARTKRLIPWVW
jgi:protein-S-isoprenylcysteine O-methyltransferase